MVIIECDLVSSQTYNYLAQAFWKIIYVNFRRNRKQSAG